MFHALFYVQTRYIHVHFVFASMLVYILVQTLFIQCTYQVHTLNVQVQVFMHIEYKAKSCLRRGSNSLPCADRRAALTIGVICIDPVVIVYIYCCTWRLVTYVWRRTSRPPRPRHDVAGPSLTWISLKPRSAAKQAREALEALMWLRYSGEMAREEEPAT